MLALINVECTKDIQSYNRRCYLLIITQNRQMQATSDKLSFQMVIVRARDKVAESTRIGNLHRNIVVVAITVSVTMSKVRQRRQRRGTSDGSFMDWSHL